LLAELRDVMRHAAQVPERQPERLSVAATDSLLASWLPGALRRALGSAPQLRLELHAHRGPMLLERVRSGDYGLGLCPTALQDKELRVRQLGHEPMVIVPAHLEPLSPAAVVPVWAIETHSLTWEAIATRLQRLPSSAGFAIRVEARLESFTALVQVARAGFANALVPLGVARELGVDDERLLRIPGLTRPIAAVGRASVFERPGVRALLGALRVALPVD
jgi:DNA-binding transcriptional LysR family regulator